MNRPMKSAWVWPRHICGESTRRAPSIDSWVNVTASGRVTTYLHAYAYVGFGDTGRDLEILIDEVNP